MLQETKPDFVSICPRWVDQHCEMVLAAVEAGVKGIYLEKPMCRTLAEADQIVAACEKHGVKLAQAFQTRYSPKLRWIDELVANGQLGEILEIRVRGKEDRRGGAEDLFVLGVHMFNLMQYFGGQPRWCFATVEVQGRPITRDDVQEGNEGLGPLAGDNVHAMYRLEKGPVGYFDSRRDAQGRPTRFGIQIYGSKGIVQLFNTGQLPEAFFLPDSSWSPGRSKKAVDSYLLQRCGKAGNDRRPRLARWQCPGPPRSDCCRGRRSATKGQHVRGPLDHRDGYGRFRITAIRQTCRASLKTRENPLTLL